MRCPADAGAISASRCFGCTNNMRREVGKGPPDFTYVEILSPYEPLASVSSVDPTMPNNVRKRSDAHLLLAVQERTASKSE